MFGVGDAFRFLMCTWKETFLLLVEPEESSRAANAKKLKDVSL